jgi:acetyl esterase/lipase
MRRVALVLLLALVAPASAAARPYVERTGPEDAPGAVIVLRGGGWVGDQPWKVAATRATARRFAAHWLTLNTDYRSTAAGFDDVVALYDYLRAERGPDFPICVWGSSAGGTWALLLAQQRDVACTIAEAAPTDLRTIGPFLQPAVNWAFGTDPAVLERYSPAARAADTHGPVLLVDAEPDLIVARDQADAFLAGAPDARLLMLPAGDGKLLHAHAAVDSGALTAAWDAEVAFVQSVLGG